MEAAGHVKVMAAVGLLIVLVACACAGPASRPDPPPRRIGVSFVDIDEPTELIQRGVFQSARQRVERVRWNSAGKSPVKQRADLDEFFAEPVEVLILQPADADVLAYARSRAAAKGIPLIWIREPRIGPVDPPPDLSRVETDWVGAFRAIAGAESARVVATRPAEREGLLAALRSGCAATPEGCRGLAAIEAAEDGAGPSFALDDEAYRRVLPSADPAIPAAAPVALASEACARELLAGRAGGCLDTRPFEIGREAYRLARQALAECDARLPAPPAGGGRDADDALTRDERREVGTAFPPHGCGVIAARRQAPAETAPRSQEAAGADPVPARSVQVSPRWVRREEAAVLSYRWPHLLLQGGPDADAIVGDGLR